MASTENKLNPLERGLIRLGGVLDSFTLTSMIQVQQWITVVPEHGKLPPQYVGFEELLDHYSVFGQFALGNDGRLWDPTLFDVSFKDFDHQYAYLDRGSYPLVHRESIGSFENADAPPGYRLEVQRLVRLSVRLGNQSVIATIDYTSQPAQMRLTNRCVIAPGSAIYSLRSLHEPYWQGTRSMACASRDP